jgi:hypothetical protein
VHFHEKVVGGTALVLYCLLLGEHHLTGQDEYVHKYHCQQCSSSQDSQEQQVIWE